MRLLYCPWNFEDSSADSIIEAVRTIHPFSKIFNEVALKRDVELPTEDASIYDVWPLAQRNAVDLSVDRLVILTTEKLLESSSMSEMELIWQLLRGAYYYGISFRDQGVSFVRPIRHEQVDGRDIDIPYGIELVCHELSATFILDEHDVCGDQKCYAYGKPTITDSGDKIPAYGRDHFCEHHAEIMLRNSEVFASGNRP